MLFLQVETQGTFRESNRIAPIATKATKSKTESIFVKRSLFRNIIVIGKILTEMHCSKEPCQ